MRGMVLGAGRSGLLALVLASLVSTAAAASTADHSKFEALKKDFASGPEVTKACLDCHTEAGQQVMHSIHWTWDFKDPNTGKPLGKQRTLNSFCGSPLSNEPRCTSCHAGYDWADKNFDHQDQSKVDCVVCHDTTGTYTKLPAGAGHPAYTPITKKDGTVIPAVNLTKVAQSVGKTRRDNCGACHFSGGGGDGVKHGDLDSSLVKPSKDLDVHMAADGANMTCATCHTFNDHIPSGSRYAPTARDTHGKDLPHDDKSRATCESCHGETPHHEAKLNDHTDRVACQTCHIPEFARGGVATKMLWDWSTAGRRDANGKPIFIKDEHGHLKYSAEKGDFAYGENVRPVYKWFNGTTHPINAGDKIDDSGILMMNRLDGDAKDPKARIWPFKEMRGKQPYDPVNKILAINHVYGKDDSAFWTHFDYSKSLKFGMEYAGLPFSGTYDFIETRMYWPITHMVPSKENAVTCAECHADDSESRLAGVGGIYLPGRDRVWWLDLLGYLALGGALAGVTIHGLLRIVLSRRTRHEH